MVDFIYRKELHLNKYSSYDTRAPFLDLNISVSNEIILSTVILHEIPSIFCSWNRRVPRATSYVFTAYLFY